MSRKWIPALLFVAVLVSRGIWLYHSGALPFMPNHRTPQGISPSSAPQFPAGQGFRGRGNAAQPWQMLPQLLGDLWFITSSITAVRWLQALARRQPKPVVSRAAA
ncbi:MAG: hypothetical protein IVW51_09310 [Thermaceae bacterium]|nr:hypothetical protein [Thermaceae bacterium]